MHRSQSFYIIIEITLAEFEIDFPVKAWLEEKMLLTTDKTVVTCYASKAIQSYA